MKNLIQNPGYTNTVFNVFLTISNKYIGFLHKFYIGFSERYHVFEPRGSFATFESQKSVEFWSSIPQKQFIIIIRLSLSEKYKATTQEESKIAEKYSVLRNTIYLKINKKIKMLFNLLRLAQREKGEGRTK